MEDVTAIKAIFNLNVVSRHEKYLGLPSVVGRNKRSFFNNFKIGRISFSQAGGKKFSLRP